MRNHYLKLRHFHYENYIYMCVCVCACVQNYIRYAHTMQRNLFWYLPFENNSLCYIRLQPVGDDVCLRFGSLLLLLQPPTLICLLFMNSHTANTKKLPMRCSCRHVFQMRIRRRRRKRRRRSEQCLEGETPPREEDYLIKNSVHNSLPQFLRNCALNLCITYSSDHDLSVQLFCSHAGIEASLPPPRLEDRTAALFASFCHINI